MQDSLRMAELLCTRLCHDLTGPIGAVNNGAEFLSEEGFNLQGQAVDLIVSSAGQAVSRLQFYRQAYGKVNDQGEASLADTKQQAQDFFQGSKIIIDWPDQYTDAFGLSVSRKLARLMLNLFIIVSGCMIRGGTIAVKVGETDNGRRKITLTGDGEGVKWDKELEAAMRLKVDIEQLTPKTVQACLSGKLAQELNVKIDATHNDKQVELVVTG